MTKIGPGWEHYDYEVSMLIYTYNSMSQLSRGITEETDEDKKMQLKAMWNAYYESWAVHASNLLGTVESNNIPDEIVDTATLMLKQVFTLTEEGRVSSYEDKVNSSRINAMMNWLYTNIEKSDEMEKAFNGEG